MNDHDHLTALLGRLKLTALRDQLDSLIDEAGRRELTIREALTQQGLDSLAVRSSVTDRAEYLRRPDRGRTLHADAETALAAAGWVVLRTHWYELRADAAAFLARLRQTLWARS